VAKGASAHGLGNPNSVTNAPRVYRSSLGGAKAQIRRDHERRRSSSGVVTASGDATATMTDGVSVSSLADDLDFVGIMLGEVDVR
jgi:hypothetical protein